MQWHRSVEEVRKHCYFKYYAQSEASFKSIQGIFRTTTVYHRPNLVFIGFLKELCEAFSKKEQYLIF